MLTTIGRVLRDHWPALLAWYVAGTLGHYWAIELAGVVGAYTDVGGVLLQPFAPLAKLISYVAMLLVVRDGLRHLGVLAPRPDDPRERRRDFGRALLGGIVPFVAFYTAYSYLAEDFKAVVLRTLGDIAPEADLSTLAPDVSFRDQLDVDSMDLLNFVIALHVALHVDIPEADYPKLDTLEACVNYLAAADAMSEQRREASGG